MFWWKFYTTTSGIVSSCGIRDYKGCALRGRYIGTNETKQQIEIRKDNISNTITTVQKDSLVIEYYTLRYERTEWAKKIRKQYEAGLLKERRCKMREYTTRKDGLCNTITTVQKDNYILVVTKLT